MEHDSDTNSAGAGGAQIEQHSAESATVDHSGRTLGSYQLVRLIAEGGMGVVYEAVQLNLARRVAVKILSEELAMRPEFVQRFQREAKAAAALNHPNMVQVHDFCQTDGFCFLAMEYVEGQNLSDYVEEQGKLGIHESLDLIEQAALALKAASEKAIIHRDIKPSNLMLTHEGRVKVSDLGLAKILTETSDLTLTGVAMGSPYFIAPEQASDAADVDHRVDIYSLGLTLLYLLTGKRPFEGNTPFSIVLAQATKPLPSGAELGTALPTGLEVLVQKMAAKNPDDRYPDYDQLLTDLRRVKAGHAPVPEPAASRRNFSSARVYVPAAVLVAVASASLLLYVVRTRPKAVVRAEAFSETAAASSPKLPETVGGKLNREPPPREGRERAPEFSDRMERPPGPEDEPPERGARSRILLPLGRLERPTPVALKADTPEAMLAEANKYGAAHPQNFRELVDCYRTVAERARGTAVGQKATEKQNQVIEQHQSALRRALQDYEARMNDKLRARKPQEAYDVWKQFPENLRTRQSDQEIEQILERSMPPGFSTSGRPD
jgi:serine/threonine protein kinase